jgi:hypothetical protein
MASGSSRDMLGFWMGGVQSPAVQGGFRSLLAFWMGGAETAPQAQVNTIPLSGFIANTGRMMMRGVR